MKNSGVVIIALVICLIGAMSARTGGPDAYGYRFLDSEEPSVEFEWIDIVATGSAGPTGDDSYRVVSLPSNFEWYGTNYNQVTMCTNGWVAIGSVASSDLSVDTIPSTSFPNNVLAINYCDLHAGYSTPPRGIYYQDMGDNTFVITYNDVYELSYTTVTFTMQVVLDCSRNTVRYNYLDVTPFMSSYREGFVGIEDNTGTIGLCYGVHRSTTSPLSDSLSVLFRSNLVYAPPYFNVCYTEDDFETDGGDDIWELGRPMVGPDMPPSFPYCWCTIKDANYPNSVDDYLYMPRMDVFGCGMPIFDWYQWYDIDSASDGGIVELTTNDGITWFQVTPEQGYPCAALNPGSALSGQPAYTGTSGDWEYQSVNLMPWVSSGELRLRFRFASDASGVAPGWYIDDIGLTEAFGVIKGHVDLGYRSDESGALVRIDSIDIEDISEVDGSYFLDRVKVGTWNISCTRDSFASAAQLGIAIARDETVEVDFYLPPTLMATNFDTNSADGVSDPPGRWQHGRPDPMVPPPGEATGPFGTDSLCWGTNLSGNYTNNANWGLEFTVPLLAEYPAMTIWHWYKMSGEYVGYLWDAAIVKCKGQYDTTWTIVDPVEGYDGPVSDHNPWVGGKWAFGGEDNGSYWHYNTFYLYDWAMDTAIIRFEIAADGAGTNRGWYIDNLVIVDDPSGTSSVGEEYLRPREIAICAYPNPFNATTTLQFDIPNAGDVELNIYDIAGRKIKTLSDGHLDKGSHRIIWDGRSDEGRDLPTGVYLTSITFADQRKNIRLVLMK